MATKKSDLPPKPMNLGTYTNLVGRKAHKAEDLVAFAKAYRRGHDTSPIEFPAVQTRENWEYSFQAWLQLRDVAMAIEEAPPPAIVMKPEDDPTTH
jgi:hypothetical protein